MLKEQFPWLNTDGIAIGCFGKKRFRQKRERKNVLLLLLDAGVQNEGWLDPWALLTAFRQKAMSLGVVYLNGNKENQ